MKLHEYVETVKLLASGLGDEVMANIPGVSMVLALEKKEHKDQYLQLPFVTVWTYRNPKDPKERGILTLRFRT